MKAEIRKVEFVAVGEACDANSSEEQAIIKRRPPSGKRERGRNLWREREKKCGGVETRFCIQRDWQGEVEEQEDEEEENSEKKRREEEDVEKRSGEELERKKRRNKKKDEEEEEKN